jgi:hypothetical protein
VPVVEGCLAVSVWNGVEHDIHRELNWSNNKVLSFILVDRDWTGVLCLFRKESILDLDVLENLWDAKHCTLGQLTGHYFSFLSILFLRIEYH